MSQAQPNIDSPPSRLRPEKVLRPHGRYTGNLSAYGDAGAAIAANSAFIKTHSTADHVLLPKSRLALFIGGAAITGAVIGGLLFMPSQHNTTIETPVAGDVQLIQQAPVQDSEQTPMQDAVQTAESVSVNRQAPPLVASLSPPSAPIDQSGNSLENAMLPVSNKPLSGESIDEPVIAMQPRDTSEVDGLNQYIVSLQQEIDSLTDETFELNSELLQLELQMVALKDQPVPVTETRVVYNFVNVPLGRSLDSVTTPVPRVEQAQYNDRPTSPSPTNDIAYDDVNGFHRNTQATAPSDSEAPDYSTDRWQLQVSYPPIPQDGNE